MEYSHALYNYHHTYKRLINVFMVNTVNMKYLQAGNFRNILLWNFPASQYYCYNVTKFPVAKLLTSGFREIFLFYSDQKDFFFRVIIFFIFSFISFVDMRCSGQTRCEFLVSETMHPTNKIRPCPVELAHYLQAGFQCIHGKIWKLCVFFWFICKALLTGNVQECLHASFW